MIGILAWRNVWRNKVRSLVVILAVAIGLFGTIFVAAISAGMIAKLVETTIDNELSDLQIHSADYAISEDIRDVFSASEVQAAVNRSADMIDAYSYRLKSEAMAASANSSSQVALFGIDSAKEANVTSIKSLIQEGQYFGTDTRLKEIVVGRKLVDELKVKLGSKIVLSFADVNGDIMYESFKITGIYKTNNSEFDKLNVYALQSDLIPILKTGEGNFHEFASRISADNLDAVYKSMVSSLQGYDVRRWHEVNPNLLAMGSLMDLSTFIMITIVLIALIFGVINTMLMVVMERRKELGMLRALGMGNMSIGRMIVLETVFLAVIGGLLGNGLSFFMVSFYGRRGIRFESTAEGMEMMGIGEVVYPTLGASAYVGITILVVITALVASIFPVRRALKQNIAETIRN